MVDFSQVTIDTNFFITLFSENPDEFKEFYQILKRLKIKIVISDFIKKEMRWYMSRIIVPNCEIMEINPTKLAEYEKQIRPKVGKLPQTPDVSVAYVADVRKIPLISSDLKLIQIADKLKIKTFMNSAFAIYLINNIELTEDRILMEKYHAKLFAEEVSYSVKSQHVYDPVIRIKAIMDSALDVVRSSATSSEKVDSEIQKVVDKVDLDSDYDFPEYHDLAETTLGIRRDLDKYVTLLDTGNQKSLHHELKMQANTLIDLCSEIRLLGIPETDKIYREAITTVAHLLLLSSTAALSIHDIKSAENYVEQLTFMLFELQEVADRLEMEVHLQRIILFFLTKQLNRLRTYFSPAFWQKCHDVGREDIIILLRTFGIISAAITNHKAEPTAEVRDFSEVEFTIQLGYQFITIGNHRVGWLLLEQAVYMSVNSNITGLLFAVFEVLLPLHFANQNLNPPLSPSIEELLDFVAKKKKEIPLDNYYDRLSLKEVADPDILINRAKNVDALPSSLQGFLDVVSAEETTFTRIGRVTLVRVIDWQTMNMIGIVDPSLTLEDTLTVGASVQVLSGKVRLIPAPAKLKEQKGINLVIICREDDLQFVIRRSGVVSVLQASAKVNEYDLD
jgi:predicted nucleic acid-binding protein